MNGLLHVLLVPMAAQGDLESRIKNVVGMAEARAAGMTAGLHQASEPLTPQTEQQLRSAARRFSTNSVHLSTRISAVA